jgi:hypothetical protein
MLPEQSSASSSTMTLRNKPALKTTSLGIGTIIQVVLPLTQKEGTK